MIETTGEEVTYTTKVRNERLYPASLYDQGKVMRTLIPGETIVIESVNPNSLYARWNEIVFKGRHEVKLVPRPDWTEPERGPNVITCINVEGNPLETRFIGGRQVWLPRNIPVLVGVPAEDPVSQYDRLEIKQQQHKKPCQEFHGYVVYRWALEDVYHERD